MRRGNTQNISDILKQFTKDKHYDQKLRETQLVQAWGDMLGPMVKNATTNIYVSNRTLFVSINSSVMRHELSMMRTKIVKSLNEQVGGSVIDNILFR